MLLMYFWNNFIRVFDENELLQVDIKQTNADRILA